MTPVEMVPVPYTWVLALSAVLFAIGTVGVLLNMSGLEREAARALLAQFYDIQQ